MALDYLVIKSETNALSLVQERLLLDHPVGKQRVQARDHQPVRVNEGPKQGAQEVELSQLIRVDADLVARDGQGSLEGVRMRSRDTCSTIHFRVASKGVSMSGDGRKMISIFNSCDKKLTDLSSSALSTLVS